MEAFIAHRHPQRRGLQTVRARGRRIHIASPVESEKTDPPRREKFRERHAPRRIERARSAGLDERSVKKRVRYDRGRQECPGGLQRELRAPTPNLRWLSPASLKRGLMIRRLEFPLER